MCEGLVFKKGAEDVCSFFACVDGIGQMVLAGMIFIILLVMAYVPPESFWR